MIDVPPPCPPTTALAERDRSRIGLAASADALRARLADGGESALRVLDDLLSAHETAIPFENLDVLAALTSPGRTPVSLDPPALARKLLDRRRGGFCHEHAALFQLALGALGVSTRPVLARILMRPDPQAGPLSHQATLAQIDGREVLVDPGFGAGTPPVALPLDSVGDVRATPQGDYRLAAADEFPPERRADHEFLVQQRSLPEGPFRSLYGFSRRRVEPIDVEMSCWWAATRPGTRFTSGLTVSLALPGGGRLAVSDRELRLTHADGSRETHVMADPASLRTTLSQQFGLDIDDDQTAAVWAAIPD